MNAHSRADTFASLSSSDQLDFLLRLAHDLTIVGRDTYRIQSLDLESPRRLRSLNEVQHRILAFCVALLHQNPKRYPDDVLMAIIFEHPEDVVLRHQIEAAFDRVLGQMIPCGSREDECA
jgi:hypothetical protein